MNIISQTLRQLGEALRDAGLMTETLEETYQIALKQARDNFGDDQGFETVELDIDDGLFAQAARRAHDQNMTFNALIVKAVEAAIAEATETDMPEPDA